MKTAFFTIVSLVFLATICVAQNNPSDTVRQYCQKDFEGVRLSSETWDQVASLVTWEVEQGWDVVTGISGYKIISEEISKNKATVRVEFINEAGTMREHISINLREEDGSWKIAPPGYRPHVSQVLLCEKYNKCE